MKINDRIENRVLIDVNSLFFHPEFIVISWDRKCILIGNRSFGSVKIKRLMNRVVRLFRFLIQFGIISILLLISTVAAWYEGSAILDNPWEWKYSTPFSQLLNGEVHNNSDIAQLDYFIYAAKFQPTFPVVMVISIFYLFILIGSYFLKGRYKWFAYYLFLLSGGFLFLSSFIFHSPTLGGRIFFYLFLINGVFCTVIAVIKYIQIFNHNTNGVG